MNPPQIRKRKERFGTEDGAEEVTSLLQGLTLDEPRRAEPVFDALTLGCSLLEGPVLQFFDDLFWRSFVKVCASLNGDVPGPHADAEERRRWEETEQMIVDNVVASPPFYADSQERSRWVEMAQTIADDLASAPPFELATAPQQITGMERG